ncbi:MAG: hypothetical protein P4L52_01385 [Acidocella sp.]|nr:hypothetical protein [Acidocella sp.]
MRFFNLDLHIGVIGDLKQIFTAMGHDVTDWTLSAHAWVLGRKRDKVDVVNEGTWRGLDKTMCDAFHARYKDELSSYDAFIVTHTPSFAMLYERWNKPIICVASTRYEAPFTHDRAAWETFNAYLRTKIDEGIVIPIANNKYDAAYAERFTQRKWQVIPSLCNYTQAPYTGTRAESLYVSKFRLPCNVPGLIDKADEFKRGLLQKAAHKLGLGNPRQGYSWREISAFRSAVVIPYNASIMSIFEMYAAGLPMLFPTHRFAAELYADHRQQGVFSELSYNQVRGLPSGSAVPCGAPDPNDYEDVAGMMQWTKLADFYDPSNLDHLCYFDSFEELEHLLRTCDWQEMHQRMVEHHRRRTEAVFADWECVLAGVAERLGKSLQESLESMSSLPVVEDVRG